MMEPLTKKWAEGALKAVRETIKKYEKHEKIDCPLCAFAFYKTVSCYLCPWLVFNEQFCATDARFHLTPIPLRLRRLRGWEKKLVNILGRGKK